MVSRTKKIQSLLEGFKLGTLGATHKFNSSPAEIKQEFPNKPFGFEKVESTFYVWKEAALIWKEELGLNRISASGLLTVGLHLVEVSGKDVPELMISNYLDDSRDAFFTYRHKAITFKHSPGKNWFERNAFELEHQGLKSLKFPDGWIKVNERRN